ncbi:hypothetical protein LPB79_13110 [Rhizobium sp. T136]|uniref:hypothetical protein n=1 Tax=Rhizobium sp. T136 TaxID=555319 RepID=UPI001E3C58E0|nr:hypothetical protein [Rhizobium sp. T136]UFS83186.1 hypothetical protein LPB79_13110 [Rhizobium sp. T136]
MTDPQTVIEWMDRRMWSIATWLETFGRSASKPRPELDIAAKEEDLRMFTELRGAYEKALAKKRASEAAA